MLFLFNKETSHFSWRKSATSVLGVLEAGLLIHRKEVGVDGSKGN